MNAMWIDRDLRTAADNHFKEHQKLILEAGQMLATALNEYGLDDLSWYRSTHVNHPMSIWTRTSSDNWFLMLDYMYSLHESFYGYSYSDLQQMDADLDRLDRDGEIHKTFKKVVQADVGDAVRLALPNLGVTARPVCTGDFEPSDEAVSVEDKYREYYLYKKQVKPDNFTWRQEPAWI